MNQLEQKKPAKDFVKRWQEAEDQKFWIELCQNVLGIANPTINYLDF